MYFFFFQAEDGIRDFHVTGVQTCALPISLLTRIAHAPSQIVVTTNYDYGLEAAAREIGREPVTLHPRSALVTAAPTEGHLVVIHVHGVHDEPASIVLPGRSVRAL